MRTFTLLAIFGVGCVPTEADAPAIERQVVITTLPPFVIGTPLSGLQLLPAVLPEDGGSYAYTESMPAGSKLFRVPVAPGLADGACLDLSDPVFYVRHAPINSQHPNDWIMFLPGGGSVQGADNVVSTWYDEPNGGTSYGEMSSRWAAPSIGPGGVFNHTNPTNPFADWNLVFIHKCSYDRFMGRRTAHAEPLLEDHHPIGYMPGSQNQVGTLVPLGTQIRIAYRGHDIVDAVIDTLADTTVSYNDIWGEWTMPSLANANTVMFIGHSGGSRGATMIIDDVAAHLRDAAPGVDVRFVTDGGFDPAAKSVVTGATYPSINYPTNDPANGGDPFAVASDLQDGFETHWNADGDATCVDNEIDPGLCGDNLHVLMNWVETPMFIRQDLADAKHMTAKDVNGATIHDCWQVNWDPDPYACYGDTFQHGGAVLAQVADLALLRTQALSHTVLGTVMPRPSGFFPACGHHDGAHTDNGFDDTLTTAGGITTSYANALLNWYRFPNIPIRSVESTPPTTIPTVCPGE